MRRKHTQKQPLGATLRRDPLPLQEPMQEGEALPTTNRHRTQPHWPEGNGSLRAYFFQKVRESVSVGMRHAFQPIGPGCMVVRQPRHLTAHDAFGEGWRHWKPDRIVAQSENAAHFRIEADGDEIEDPSAKANRADIDDAARENTDRLNDGIHSPYYH